MDNAGPTVSIAIMGEATTGRVSGVGIASATRSVDISGIYCEITVRVEGNRWGGRLGNSLTIYPRPSIPVMIPVYTEEWDAVDKVGNDDALPYALDKATDQALDWVQRFVLPLPSDAR